MFEIFTSLADWMTYQLFFYSRVPSWRMQFTFLLKM